MCYLQTYSVNLSSFWSMCVPRQEGMRKNHWSDNDPSFHCPQISCLNSNQHYLLIFSADAPFFSFVKNTSLSPTIALGVMIFHVSSILYPVALHLLNQPATIVKLFSLQIQLKEYVKLHDTIYEVDPTEEECFRFSRLLNFKVSLTLIHFVCLSVSKHLQKRSLKCWRSLWSMKVF